MEGRKAVGGKLEVRIRIRDPFVNKQVEEVKEKWLIIDHLERKPLPVVQVNASTIGVAMGVRIPPPTILDGTSHRICMKPSINFWRG